MFLATLKNPIVYSVWFEIANYVEFLTLCISIVAVTVTIRMLTSIPLHRHLFMLLHNVLLTEFFVTTVRFVMLAIDFYKPYAIERGFATLMFSTYEKQNRIHTVLFGCFLQHIFGTIAVCLIHLHVLTLAVCICIGLGIVFVSVILYLIFNVINQRKYQVSFSTGTSYTLSQKFQLRENLRMSSFLTRACVISALMNILQCLAFEGVHYFKNDPLMAQIMYSMGNFFFACFGLMLSLLALTDRRLTNLCRRQLLLVFPFVSLETSGNHKEDLQEADGKQMVFDQEQEYNKHFRELNKAWA